MPGFELIRFYHGSSMRGTFRFGDCLEIERADLDDIRCGDIVIYHGSKPDAPDGATELVHRIVSKKTEGLVARGDNNLHPDPVLVSRANLVGRVWCFFHNGKRFRVKGGHLGLFYARILHRLITARKWIRILGGGAYRGIRLSGLIRRVWHPDIAVIRFMTEKGPLLKYIHHGRTVAWRWSEKNRFDCRKPYDLVLSQEDPNSGFKSGRSRKNRDHV